VEEVQPDLEDLLRLLPHADVDLQDEVQVAFRLTLTHVWCQKGRHGQRFVDAHGANEKVEGFGFVDWAPAGLMAAWLLPRRWYPFRL
jgi:hypothetical protein